MAIDLRAIERERTDDYNRAVYRGFHVAVIDERDIERRRERWLEGRWFAALDDDRIVSTVRTLPLDTTVPGGAVLTSCGITAVTTLPTHRRRGLMSQLLRAGLRDGRERGEPLSTLIAAEWPIYGRHGFGPAVEHATYEIDASVVRFTSPGRGRVEMVDADGFLAAAPAVYDRHRAASVGEITRDPFVWHGDAHGSPDEPYKGFFALCRDGDGTATGYVRYSVDTHFDQRRPAGRVDVHELIAADDEAELALWRYVAGIDWVTKVVAENRSVDERLPHRVVDGRHVRQTARADFVWARPLDVAACLRARRYAAPLDLVLEVTDPVGVSDGRWRLRTDGRADVAPGAASDVSCEPTAATPDLTLPVATLGAALLGGTPLATLARAGLADEHRAGAVRAATLAFRGDGTPWSASWF